MSHPALARLPKGWFHHGEQMLALLEQHRPRVVVELGTKYGASAIAMARVLRTWGGVLYCVDTWGGVPGPWCTFPNWIGKCAAHLMATDVSASVRLIPATTADAAQRWVGSIDCLYIDADHRYAGVAADLVHWWPHVRSGGLIVGDDYDHPDYPGVTRAWDEFEVVQGVSFQRVLTPNTRPQNMRLIYGVKP